MPTGTIRNLRRIHLINLENLAGSPLADENTILRIWQTYFEGIGLREGDHVVVATGPGMAAKAWFALPATGIQRRVKRGHAGADLALVDSLDLRRDPSRFGTLIIASGSHIFEPVARAARQAGMGVWNVAGRGEVARPLAAACTLRSRLRLGGPILAKQPTLGHRAAFTHAA